MHKAAYFTLILCGILAQGNCERSNASEENNGIAATSTDNLIRQKRVVGGVIRPFTDCTYLVNVLVNGNYHCPATLLTNNFAISSATCFINHNTQNMRLASRSIGGTTLHEIVRVIFLDPDSAHPTFHNLALVRFSRPINYRTSNNRPISIYNRYLPTDHSTVRVVTWATYTSGGTLNADNHFITFPVFLTSYEYCQNSYPNIIGTGNICAIGSNAGEYLDTYVDSGTPLIKNSQVLGIFVYRCTSCATKPNIFMNLLDHDIRLWIQEHVPSLHLV